MIAGLFSFLAADDTINSHSEQSVYTVYTILRSE